MSSTKCVWIRFKTKSNNAASMGNKSSPLLEAHAPQVPGLTTLWRTSPEICQEHKIWFHVDGAHGASAAFSDTHRHLVAGMERADSVVLDFHKTCGIPALCTGVFYADKNDSYLPFSQHAEYLWDHADEAHWWDTGKRTFECTKRMLSTRLAAVKAEYGWGIWTELVDRMWALGAALASMVEERADWELAMPPQANIVCFRPKRPATCDEATWNEVVRALRKRHLRKALGIWSKPNLAAGFGCDAP